MSQSRGIDHAGRYGYPERRRTFIGLLLLLFVLGFSFQGTRSIWGTDEGRYVGNAIQMIDSGNYLVPSYSPDRVNFSKPPLTYWVIAGSMRLLGRNAWAVRLPYALAFIFTALLVYAMGKRLVPERPWLPPLVYASSVVPFISANVVNTDVLLVLFEALAMYGFVASRWDPEPASRGRYVLLMWLGFGLAFLTKGPPGLIALLGVIPFVVKQEGWAGARRLFRPLGLVVFLVVGLTWYAIVVIRYPGVFHYFVHYEIYDRIFTSVQHRNGQWYGWIEVYVPVLLIGALPWWPMVVRSAISGMRHGGISRIWKRADANLFLLLWFLVPLAVFILSRSRLPLYILPLFMPLALLISVGLQGRVNPRDMRQQIGFAIWIVLLLSIKGFLSLHFHSHRDNRMRARILAHQTTDTRYDAMVFVENTADNGAIEEHTPWGIRFYIDKPIYGVAWRRPVVEPRFCAIWNKYHAVVYATDTRLDLEKVHAELRSCSPAVSIRKLGILQHWTLELARHAD